VTLTACVPGSTSRFVPTSRTIEPSTVTIASDGSGAGVSKLIFGTLGSTLASCDCASASSSGSFWASVVARW
jgi:hypothetical protein